MTVVAGTSTGNPARSTDSRATLSPCDASGIAQPQITSSMSLGDDTGPTDGSLEHFGREIDGVNVGERAVLLPAPDGGADGGDDNGVVRRHDMRVSCVKLMA